MATFARTPFEATHRAEIIFTRDLSVQYGIAEVETDYEIVFFIGEPEESQLKDRIPEGWQFKESHVGEIDEFDFDEDGEEIYVEPYNNDNYFDDDAEFEFGELELEAV